MKKDTEKKEANSFYQINCLVGQGEETRVIDLAKKIEVWLEKKKGAVLEVEKKVGDEDNKSKSAFWVEKRALAYPIKKVRYGYYLNAWFSLLPEYIDGLKDYLGLEQDLIRFQILGEKGAKKTAPAYQALALTEIGKVELSSDRRRDFFREERKPRQDKKIEKFVREEAGPEKESGTLTGEIDKKKTREHIERKMADELPKKEVKIEKRETVAKKVSSGPAVKSEEEILPPGKIQEKDEAKTAEKKPRKKKITLEELDQRLDDILNEEIL
jgi:ribosomal protein S6